jgi:hypothetical protein
MNPKLHFIHEFIKLLGRLADAAYRNDTPGFLGLLRSLEENIRTVRTTLTVVVRDFNDDVDDDEL